MDWGTQKNKNYDKIKHLVEVDDDILAVFIMTTSRIEELYIAKNSNINKDTVDLLVSNLDLAHDIYKTQKESENTGQLNNNYNLGKIKWIVIEYENLRILKLYELNKTVFVLIKSNTQLQHTVDNILGYYYDLDDIPKSLF